jgi:hypothetical protein
MIIPSEKLDAAIILQTHHITGSIKMVIPHSVIMKRIWNELLGSQFGLV